jgi:hypothetical protein
MACSLAPSANVVMHSGTVIEQGGKILDGVVLANARCAARIRTPRRTTVRL